MNYRNFLFTASFKKFVKLGLVKLLLLTAIFQTPGITCSLKSTDRAWAKKTIDLWQTVRRDSLKLKSAPLPWVVLFDEKCTWHLNPNLSVQLPKLKNEPAQTRLSSNGKFVEVHGFTHEGKIKLTDQSEIPPQLSIFTSVYGNDKNPFFVFPMPSIWEKAAPLKSEMNKDIGTRSVFVHEMTHTRHQNISARIDELEKKHPLPANFNDDIIQNHFEKNKDFLQVYEQERDLLYQAVNESNKQQKRKMAKKALNIIQTRHQQFFSGNNAIFAELEDIFLTMEGTASWAAYKSKN